MAIAGVDTKNNGARPVAEHYFTGRAVIDPREHHKVHVYIGHHMSDGVAGAGSGGSIRVLLIGEIE